MCGLTGTLRGAGIGLLSQHQDFPSHIGLTAFDGLTVFDGPAGFDRSLGAIAMVATIRSMSRPAASSDKN
jgi:hypothetical protein